MTAAIHKFSHVGVKILWKILLKWAIFFSWIKNFLWYIKIPYCGSIQMLWHITYMEINPVMTIPLLLPVSYIPWPSAETITLKLHLVLMSEDSSTHWHHYSVICKDFIFATWIFKLCSEIDGQTTKSCYCKRENCQKMTEGSGEMRKQNQAKELKPLSIKLFFFLEVSAQY